MADEKIVWVNWEEKVERYICPHEKAASLMAMLTWTACTPEAALVSTIDGEPQVALRFEMEDVVAMLNLPMPDSDYEHELALEVLGNAKFALCRDCFIKVVFEEKGRWAVITRDMGEILRAGDQNPDPETVRALVLADLEEQERGLRGMNRVKH